VKKETPASPNASTFSNAFSAPTSPATSPLIPARIKNAPAMTEQQLQLATLAFHPSDLGPTHVASLEELTHMFYGLAARVTELERRWRERIVERNSDGK
jgi:hypothetical protein